MMRHSSNWGRWFGGYTDDNNNNNPGFDDFRFAGRGRGGRGRGRGGRHGGPGGPPGPGGPGGGGPGGGQIPPGAPPPWGRWGGVVPPFGPWAGGFREMFGGGRRARRGNVRAAILSLLAEQPRNGYQLMQELEVRSQGTWRPSSGSVYPTLSQLEDEGLVETAVIAGNKAFKLTKQGEDYVKANADELRSAWEVGTPEAGDPRVELMRLFKSIATAAMQVFQNGTSEQVAEAKRLLSETRRGLYRILADDPSESPGDGDDDNDE